MDLALDQLRALTGHKLGDTDVACPVCGPSRRSRINQTRTVLRIWDDGEFVTYTCARCGISGWAKGKISHVARHSAVAPATQRSTQERSATANALWQRSVEAAGSPVEAYLNSRNCWLQSTAIRYLPGNAKYPAAMIARYGAGEITGVHMTRINADNTRGDKIMLGPSVGQPIIVHDNPDRAEIVVTEGIEDALSYALVTGWTAWAAGSVGRILRVIPALPAGAIPYLSVDHDRPTKLHPNWGGIGAIIAQRASAMRPDLITIGCASLIGIADRLDANKILITYGKHAGSGPLTHYQHALLDCIEAAQAKHQFSRREISFERYSVAINTLGRWQSEW